MVSRRRSPRLPDFALFFFMMASTRPRPLSGTPRPGPGLELKRAARFDESPSISESAYAIEALEHCAPYLSSILSSPARDGGGTPPPALSTIATPSSVRERSATEASAIVTAVAMPSESESDSTREQTAKTVLSMLAELQQLRAMHQRELAEVRRESAKETEQLRVWYADQLIAVEQQLEGRHHVDAALAKGETERLALRTALAAARRRASAAVDETKRGRFEAMQLVAARDNELVAARRRARSECLELVDSRANELAQINGRSEDMINELRRETKSLTATLHTVQQSAAKADARAVRAEAARAKAVEALRASEARVEALKRSLYRATPRVSATPRRGARPPETPTLAWH